MDKLVYIAPDLNISMFSDDSIITASTDFTTRDPDKPIELPFVPVIK